VQDFICVNICFLLGYVHGKKGFGWFWSFCFPWMVPHMVPHMLLQMHDFSEVRIWVLVGRYFLQMHDFSEVGILGLVCFFLQMHDFSEVGILGWLFFQKCAISITK
jgi:hypothetical protein